MSDSAEDRQQKTMMDLMRETLSVISRTFRRINGVISAPEIAVNAGEGVGNDLNRRDFNVMHKERRQKFLRENRFYNPDGSLNWDRFADHVLSDDNALLQGSPLILDLDGDGVEAGGVALFDHEGDGFAELSRWVGGDDGLLVWDRNGDGMINDGSELFGDNTVLANGDKASNGFVALAELDSNRDSIIDARDVNFAALQILRWTDTDGDGEKDAMELVSLADVGVQSLNTGYVNSDHIDEFGNAHRQVGSFTKADGTTAAMTDVWFVRNRMVSVYDGADMPAHSEAVSGLPNLLGSGRVYDLRDAMALDDAGRLSAPFYDGERSETRALRELAAARDGASCPLLWPGGGNKAGKAGVGLDFWR